MCMKTEPESVAMTVLITYVYLNKEEGSAGAC